MVKNPSSSAGDAGSIPGRGTKIPLAAGQLSPCATTRESECRNYRDPVLWSPCATTREKPVHRNKEPTHHNERSHVPQLRPDAAKNNNNNNNNK